MRDGESRKLWSLAGLGSLLPYVIAGVLLLIAIRVLGKEISKEIGAIETWIDGTRPWSVVVFIALYVVLSSFFFPSTALSIMGGALFGVTGGTSAVVAGALTAASLQYVLGHRLLRGTIERAISKKPSMLAIQQAVRRREVRLQALLRLTPLNAAMMSYVLAATGVRFGGFLLASLAIIPGLFLEVYFGYAGKHVAHMASQHDPALRLHDAVILGGLLTTIVVMVIVARVAKNAVQAELGGTKP